LCSTSDGASCYLRFFDWYAHNFFGFCIPLFNSSFFTFGGVLDSTLGWSAPLPFEDEGWPRKSSFKKLIGNYEEMPLAA